MKIKICFKCKLEKEIKHFYKHPEMGDGHLNKCKECTKKDVKGKIERVCLECNKIFLTSNTEIRRRGGGGKTCSRECYYKRLRKIIKKDDQSPNWKGDNVGITALHNWVERNLGKPSKCEHCKTTTANKFEWANKSQKYKRDLKDWIRLCTKCHHWYDRSTRFKKWKEAVTKIGWNVTKA